MNTRLKPLLKPTSLIVSGFAVCLIVGVVWAQEPDKPVSRAELAKSHVTQEDFQAVAAGLRWMSTVGQASDDDRPAALGVHVRSVDATLGYHLDLAEGVGLVVELVSTGGAAAESGVKLHDVLKRMDDQILVNPEQLRTLVQMKRPGDQVRLEIIRGEQTLQLTATLQPGSDASSTELFHPEHMNWLTHESLAQVHDLSLPEMQNCSNCHLVNGSSGYQRN